MPQFCLTDVPCRLGELDALFSSETNVICEYSITNSSSINLPKAWNTLEDSFVLSEKEYLLSNNGLYQLILKRGNLYIYQVNINPLLFFFKLKN